MTDNVALAMITGLPLTLAAIGGLYVQLTTRGKVEVIQGHVNSEKTAAEGRENTLKVENQLLREQLAEHKNIAALLAQAAASRVRPAGIEASGGPIPVDVVNTEPIQVEQRIIRPPGTVDNK